VLAVMAHPDDAELLCGGTLARARADGAKVGLCIMCQAKKALLQRPSEIPRRNRKKRPVTPPQSSREPILVR